MLAAAIFLGSGLGGVLVSANVGTNHVTASSQIPAFGLAGGLHAALTVASYSAIAPGACACLGMAMARACQEESLTLRSAHKDAALQAGVCHVMWNLLLQERIIMG